MNKPLVFGLIIAATITGAFTYGYWYMGNYAPAFYVLLVFTVGLLGAALWFALNRERAPDVLRQRGLEYMERKGFCFAPFPTVVDGRGFLVVAYQNRYEASCEAQLIFQPDADAARAGLKILRASVQCPGGGHGEEIIPWEIPAALAHTEVRIQVGADVDYPYGRGRVLRWREGAAVGSVEMANAPLLSTIVGESSSFRMLLPEATTKPATPIRTAPVASAAGAAPPEPAIAWPGPSNEGASRARTPSVPGAQSGTPSQEMLAALVDTLSQNDALARQRSAVVSVRRSRAAVQLLGGLGVLLGGACLLAFGIVAFQQGWRVHGRILAIILGGVLALVGLIAVPFLLFELFWNSRKVVFAGTPADAFRKTCEKALREFKEDPRAWSEVAEFLAFPRFDRYAGSLDSGRALSLRWRDLRESLVADAAQIEFGPVETTPRPGFGERVVNVRMEVRVPGRSLWLHNTAVAVGDHWFLTDGEPMTGGAI